MSHWYWSIFGTAWCTEKLWRKIQPWLGSCGPGISIFWDHFPAYGSLIWGSCRFLWEKCWWCFSLHRECGVLWESGESKELLTPLGLAFYLPRACANTFLQEDYVLRRQKWKDSKLYCAPPHLDVMQCTYVIQTNHFSLRSPLPKSGQFFVLCFLLVLDYFNYLFNLKIYEFYMYKILM